MSIYLLALAALIAAAPWALRELGLSGPTPREKIQVAERTLLAARSYGAREDQAVFRNALAALEQARDLERGGKGREAVRKALEAERLGIESQRTSLAAREDMRRRARIVVDSTDDELNALEDLYAELSARKDEEMMGRLLSRMKAARQAGAGLFLAYEEGDYARVMATREAALETLSRVHGELRAAREADRGQASAGTP